MLVRLQLYRLPSNTHLLPQHAEGLSQAVQVVLLLHVPFQGSSVSKVKHRARHHCSNKNLRSHSFGAKAALISLFRSFLLASSSSIHPKTTGLNDPTSSIPNNQSSSPSHHLDSLATCFLSSPRRMLSATARSRCLPTPPFFACCFEAMITSAYAVDNWIISSTFLCTYLPRNFVATFATFLALEVFFSTIPPSVTSSFR